MDLHAVYKVSIFFLLLLFLLHSVIGFPDPGQLLDLRHGVFDLSLHPAVLQDTFLHIFDVDILFRTDVFFDKILQPPVHTERDRPFKQQRELLHVQSP